MPAFRLLGANLIRSSRLPQDAKANAMFINHDQKHHKTQATGVWNGATCHLLPREAATSSLGLKGGLTPAMIDITWIIRKSVDGEPQREWSSFHSRCTVGTFFLSDRASECPRVTGTVSAATGSKIQRQQTKDHFPGPVFCEGSWPPVSPCRGRGPLKL